MVMVKKFLSVILLDTCSVYLPKTLLINLLKGNYWYAWLEIKRDGSLFAEVYNLKQSDPMPKLKSVQGFQDLQWQEVSAFNCELSPSIKCGISTFVLECTLNLPFGIVLKICVWQLCNGLIPDSLSFKKSTLHIWPLCLCFFQSY